VFLRSDGQVTMQHMDVMDRLKDGGVEKVGLVSRPATDRLSPAMAMTSDLVSSTIVARRASRKACAR
jgi:hypothetical protein